MLSPSSRSRRGEQLERLSGVLKKHGLDCGALKGNKVIFQSHIRDLGYEQSDVQVTVTAVTVEIAVKLVFILIVGTVVTHVVLY